jgi:integral membrane protein
VRIVSWIDAVLLVLLLSLVVAGARGGVRVVGTIHGIGYLVLLGMTVMGARSRLWSWWYPVAVLVTGGPIGSIVGEWYLRRRHAG